jgi:hypothetical protein
MNRRFTKLTHTPLSPTERVPALGLARSIASLLAENTPIA